MKTQTQTETQVQALTEIRKILGASPRTAILSKAADYLATRSGYRSAPSQTRQLHLAAAFILNKPYRSVEPTAEPLKKRLGSWTSYFIMNIVHLVNYANHGNGHIEGFPLVTPDDITAWMEVPELQDARLARQVLQQRHLDYRDARRAMFLKEHTPGHPQLHNSI